MALDQDLRDLSTGKNFATLTTMLPSGHPQTQVMWIDADDDHLLINTEVHRRKFKNVEANPVATVTVWDLNSPYRYIEARGRVVDTVRGDEARAHIDACSRRYIGADYANPIQSERAILKIEPEQVHKQGF